MELINATKFSQKYIIQELIESVKVRIKNTEKIKELSRVVSGSACE